MVGELLALPQLVTEVGAGIGSELMRSLAAHVGPGRRLMSSTPELLCTRITSLGGEKG